MTVATEALVEIGVVHGVHVDELRFGVNARYGWAEGNILEAYKPRINELITAIESWGFKKTHYIEYFVDKNGDKVVLHGNNRTYASKEINRINREEYGEDAVIGFDLPAGHIYAARVETPSSKGAIVRQQVSDNTQIRRTRLDELLQYQIRIDELIENGDCKTQASAIKQVVKEDFEFEAQKLVLNEVAKDLEAAYKLIAKEDAYKDIKKQMANYETNLKKDLRLMTLSPQVLSWLQESYLDACDIKLSFGKINELLTTYGEKADLLLKEALQEVILEPREEYSQNQYLSSKWLENLAKKLGIADEEKPAKKPQKPAPVATSSDDNEDDEEKEELTLEAQVEEEEGIAEEKPKNAKTGSIQTRAKKARDYYFLQAQKFLDSNVGLMLVDATLKPLEDGLTEFSVIIPTTETAKEFQSFIDNIAAALGNAEAIAKLEAINPQPTAPEPVAEVEQEQEESDSNPLDDVDLGDAMF